MSLHAVHWKHLGCHALSLPVMAEAACDMLTKTEPVGIASPQVSQVCVGQIIHDHDMTLHFNFYLHEFLV